MSELGLRVATALPLFLAVAALLLFAPLWSIALVVALAAGLGMWEYSRLMLPGAWSLEMVMGLALAAAVPLACLTGPAGAAAALGLSLLCASLAALVPSRNLAAAVSRMGPRAWGIFYTGGLFSCLLLLAPLTHGRRLMLFLIVSVAAADIGAYFAGNLLGKHRLAPGISPGKTIEGGVGGLAAGALVAALFAALFLPDTTPQAGAALGAVLALLSIGGDLMESALKRAKGAKDSGQLLPGHGGLLDRVDGLLAAAPGLLLARILWWN
jgi:phosphatidate cytidylyltransferase